MLILGLVLIGIGNLFSFRAWRDLAATGLPTTRNDLTVCAGIGLMVIGIVAVTMSR